mgnify:CR=1 FL=1
MACIWPIHSFPVCSIQLMHTDIMKTLKLHIEGMHCDGCESAIKQAFEDSPAQVTVVDHTRGYAEVDFPEDQMSKADVVRRVHHNRYKVFSMEEG